MVWLVLLGVFLLFLLALWLVVYVVDEFLSYFDGPQ